MRSLRYWPIWKVLPQNQVHDSDGKIQRLVACCPNGIPNEKGRLGNFKEQAIQKRKRNELGRVGQGRAGHYEQPSLPSASGLEMAASEFHLPAKYALRPTHHRQVPHLPSRLV